MVCQILSSSIDFVTIWASPFFHCFYFKPLFPPFSFDNLTIFRVFATILLVGLKWNLKNKTGFTFITKEFLFIMFWVSSVNVSFPFPQKRWLIITMRALLVFIYMPGNLSRGNFTKVENILKGSLDSIPSSSHSVKIQIMGGKVYLRCKGKTLLGVVNKLLKT